MSDSRRPLNRRFTCGSLIIFSDPLPGIGEPDLNRKRGWTSKRVSNAKLRDTGWKPAFPAYRDAIASLNEEGCQTGRHRAFREPR